MSSSLARTAALLVAASTSFILTASAHHGDGTCYFPAGNVADNNVPCNPDAAVSSCCSEQSFCLANGLCLVNNDPDTVEFARGACTDPTFEDPACFQQCHGSQPGSPDTNGAAVFECGTTGFLSPASYCCENGIDHKTSCCSTSSLVFSLGPGTYTSMTSAPAATSSPSVITDTVTITDVIPCSTTTLSGGSVSVLSSTMTSISTSIALSFASTVTAMPSGPAGNATGVVTASSGVTAVPDASGANATVSSAASTSIATGAAADVKELRIGASFGGLMVAILAGML